MEQVSTATGWLAHAVGKRKEAIARVFLRSGTGKIWVNGRPVEEYFRAFAFTQDYLNRHLLTPFYLTGTLGRYDVRAKIEGGGATGQLEALRLGYCPRASEPCAGIQKAPQGCRAPHPRRPRGGTQEIWA